MTIPYVFSSGFAGFIPAANGTIVAAVRDPDSYAVNKYCQLVDAKKNVFVWHKIHFDDAGQRGLTVSADNEAIWVDGQKAPENNQNRQRFTLVEGQVIRRAWDFQIGWENIEDADLPTLMSNTMMVQNQAMTNITRRVAAILTTAANWPTTNTADASVTNGGAGFWDQATSDPASPNYLAIKKSLDTAVENIRLVTNNAFELNQKNLRLILGPKAARRISQTDEIHNYLKGSPDAKDVLISTLGNYGLPKYLYGLEIVVEASGTIAGHQTTDGSAVAIGSTGRSFVWPENTAVITSQVGGLDGKIGGPSFSTIQRFYREKELAVEVEDFKWDRLTKGRAVTRDVCKLTCGESGYCFTNIFA